ncbi:transcriptional regulator [Halobacteriales archaeon QH_6_64_20]|nr:MAG: transcriptional regulator [Halobacteriales archaeon QH_6_64_20]
MTGVRGHDDGGSAVPETFIEYAAERPDARATDWLRERSEPDWRAATEGGFVRELGAGELDDEVFRRYLVQDYAFVGELASLIGYAIGDAPTIAAKRRLTDFLGTITNEEDDYFERSFNALDVPADERRDPELTATTRALCDLLGRASREGGYAETLAVFVPAEWVYLTWAERVKEAPSEFYLAEWVDLHDNPEFASFVGWLREELDRELGETSTRRQCRIDRLFGRTVELEVAFFRTAYEG